MRTTWLINGKDLSLQARLDPDESTPAVGQYSMDIYLMTNSCRVELPHDLGEIHPDLAALAAMLVMRPWIGRRIVFDRPISTRLAETISLGIGVDASPVDDSITARAPGPIAGLSFSGGADSVAVTDLLDPTSPYIHFRRVGHQRVPDRATHITADVNQAIVERMTQNGPELRTVRSDLEFVVGPGPTYPVRQAVTIGAVLMADDLDLGAIATGNILAGEYLPKVRGFDTNNEREFWKAAYAAAGIPLMQPAHGMTEVLTQRLARQSRHADLVRWCQLGRLEGPCLGCKKCLRKELIAAALDARPVSEAMLTRLERPLHDLARFMEGPPYIRQHILEYAVARIPGIESTVFEPLKGLLKSDVDSTSWLERYYGPALVNDIPDRWRDPVRAEILRRCALMTAEDEAQVANYDPSERIAT